MQLVPLKKEFPNSRYKLSKLTDARNSTKQDTRRRGRTGV